MNEAQLYRVQAVQWDKLEQHYFAVTETLLDGQKCLASCFPELT